MNFTINQEESDNPKLEVSEISNVESILNVRLPKSYIDLMSKWNGGYLNVEYVSVLPKIIPDSLECYLEDGFWTVSSISGVSGDVNNENGLVYTAKTAHEWGVHERIIAFSGDGHTWLAFDYRNEELPEPTIIFIESDDGCFLEIADNFDTYLKNLLPADHVYDDEGNITLS